jgi:hypothetical protein
MSKEKTKTSPPTPKKRRGVRINRPDDVRRLLSKLINKTLVDETPTDTLRAVSYACQTILKVFELCLIEKKLEQIEVKLDEIRQENKKN